MGRDGIDGLDLELLRWWCCSWPNDGVGRGEVGEITAAARF